MIELPEIDELIYDLFGDTDLIESCLEEPGYRWSPMAYRFAEVFSQMFPDLVAASLVIEEDGLAPRTRIFSTPWNYIRQDSVTAD